MCGIFGIINSKNAFVDIYRGLKMIQHRGQDSCGIATYDNRFLIRKAEGLVSNAFSEDDIYRLTGTVGMGHVRYPTIGKGGVENAQPSFTNTPYGIMMAHNGNIINFYELKKKLHNEYHRYINTDVDVEAVLNIFAYHLSKKETFSFDTLCYAVEKVFEEVRGSYSVIAYIADKGFLAFRDPHGFKPIVFGEDNGRYAFASESVSLDTVGIREFRDVKPGEVVFIDNEGKKHNRQVSGGEQYACIFEWVYFARPDSTIDNINVYKSRLRLGEMLADELSANGSTDYDVVIPVPDTSRTAALACSVKLGIPYREGLIKNRYIGRTFIMPGTSNRMDAVREKLHPIREEIQGKSVLLVDDSIVRGNTSKSIVKIVRDAGAKEVHFAVYSSPLKYPCYFGIDMQRKEEFIANKLDIQSISAEIGADSVYYLSIEGMRKAVGLGKEFFCDACFSGNYPLKIDETHIKDIQDDRNGAN